MNKLLFLAVSIMMIMSSCAAPVIAPISTQTETPFLTLTPTLTPTITLTATPTLTPTIVSSPTPPRPIEWDLNPYYEKYIEQEWGGVMIKARVIIDQSFLREIEIDNVEISDIAIAEAVARTIFIIWYQRHHPSGYDWQNLAPSEVRPFLDLWAKAQQSGREADWRKVQINGVWANDLTDGDGYVQKPYNFWPMYSGDTPSDVVGLEVFTWVYVRTGEVKNIYYSSKGKHVDWGCGSNLIDGELLVYNGYKVEVCDWVDCLVDSFRSTVASMASHLVQNTGELPTYWVFPNTSIYNKMKYGGMKLDIKRKP